MIPSRWKARSTATGRTAAGSTLSVTRTKKPFTIVTRPRTSTGQLHLGHAFDETIQDVLIRWKRMSGYCALWLPGVDHAGIATQTKVEAELRKEGLTRFDLGREKFLDRVWDWKQHYGDRIVEQLKTLGSSCDWERQRFTMDEQCAKAVREAFCSLYEKGYIYRRQAYHQLVSALQDRPFRR